MATDDLTREELTPLVEAGLTLAAIAGRFDTNPQAVRRAVRRHGLPRPIEVRRRIVEAALRSGRRSLVRDCKRHGRTEFAIVGSERRLHCKLCRAEAVARRRRRVKAILVEEAGGRCVLCGYDRCVHALEFHHLDPAKKSFGLAHRGITRSIAEVRREAAKCVLVCSNCHAEIEWGATKLPEAIVPG